jgi:hypothetical protein
MSFTRLEAMQVRFFHETYFLDRLLGKSEKGFFLYSDTGGVIDIYKEGDVWVLDLEGADGSIQADALTSTVAHLLKLRLGARLRNTADFEDYLYQHSTSGSFFVGKGTFSVEDSPYYFYHLDKEWDKDFHLWVNSSPGVDYNVLIPEKENEPLVVVKHIGAERGVLSHAEVRIREIWSDDDPMVDEIKAALESIK